MSTCIETRIPTVAIQILHALKEGNTQEALRYFTMVRDIIQYEQGAVANAENSVEISERDIAQRVLDDLRSDPRFRGLDQVPMNTDSWTAWVATHTLPPKGPYIARVIYDYDPCLTAGSSISTITGTGVGVAIAVVGALGLVALLLMSSQTPKS